MFSIGSALGQGFKIWGRNFVPFTILGLILYAPVFVLAATMFREGQTLDEINTRILVFMAAPLIINIFINGVVTYGVVQEMRGQHASIGSSIAVGLKRFLPAVGVSVLMFLMVGIGAVFCLIPGLILLCVFYVSVQASVIEKPGIIGALKRSAALTQGNRLNIFGVVIILTIFNFVINKIVEKSMMPDLKTAASLAEFISGVQTLMYVSLAVSVVLGTLSATVSAVTYFQLRQDKDGVSIDEIARVFD